eukprot:3295325-Pleurochrysis_carterae.AAC.3
MQSFDRDESAAAHNPEARKTSTKLIRGNRNHMRGSIHGRGRTGRTPDCMHVRRRDRRSENAYNTISTSSKP